MTEPRLPRAAAFARHQLMCSVCDAAVDAGLPPASLCRQGHALFLVAQGELRFLRYDYSDAELRSAVARHGF